MVAVAVTTAKAAVPPYDWKAAPKAVSRHSEAMVSTVGYRLTLGAMSDAKRSPC